MTLKQDISNFIDDIRKRNKVPKFISNDFSNFNEQKSRIFYSGPYWDDNEIKNALISFLTGKWLPSGEYVHKFEIAFSKKIRASNSVMVNSGSSANLLMLTSLKKIFNWRDGDEIIVSPVGFPTTIATIIQANLCPVFIDVELISLNFDLKLIKDKISNKTKGIFLSPVLGNPPDLDYLIDICQNNNLKLILDGCDSLGTTWDNKPIQVFSDVSSCSFYPAHHITTGEGGMVVTNNKDLEEYGRKYRNYGKFDYNVEGLNFRMNEFTAAIGVVQVDRLKEIVTFKNEYAEKLNLKFGDRVKLPDGMTSGYYKYIVFEPIEKSTGKVYDEQCHNILNHNVVLPNSEWVPDNHWCVPIYYS